MTRRYRDEPEFKYPTIAKILSDLLLHPDKCRVLDGDNFSAWSTWPRPALECLSKGEAA